MNGRNRLNKMVKKIQMKQKTKYPKNKEHFKKLIPFAKKIIQLCKQVKINPVIYGSFAHFYHTKDKGMNVNDIDLWIAKKDFCKVAKEIKENTNAEVILEGETMAKSGTLIIKKENLIIELDDPDSRVISKSDLIKRKFESINFYGINAKIADLKDESTGALLDKAITSSRFFFRTSILFFLALIINDKVLCIIC